MGKQINSVVCPLCPKVLIPHGNFRKGASFSEKVAMLRRPYLPIPEDAYHMLCKVDADVFSDGENLYTHGNADGGWALMPIQEVYRSKIIHREQPVTV